MLTDSDLTPGPSIEFLGYDYMMEIVRAYAPNRVCGAPRNCGPRNNNLARAYFAMAGSFVSEMIDGS